MRVRYAGGTADQDEWISRDSPRLRPPAGGAPAAAAPAARRKRAIVILDDSEDEGGAAAEPVLPDASASEPAAQGAARSPKRPRASPSSPPLSPGQKRRRDEPGSPDGSPVRAGRARLSPAPAPERICRQRGCHFERRRVPSDFTQPSDLGAIAATEMACGQCHHSFHAGCLGARPPAPARPRPRAVACDATRLAAACAAGLDPSSVPAGARWVCSKACLRCLPDGEQDGVFVAALGLLPPKPRLTPAAGAVPAAGADAAAAAPAAAAAAPPADRAAAETQSLGAETESEAGPSVDADDLAALEALEALEAAEGSAAAHGPASAPAAQPASGLAAEAEEDDELAEIDLDALETRAAF